MNEIQFFDKATLPDKTTVPVTSIFKYKLNKQKMPSANQVGLIFLIFCIIFLIIRYRNKQGIVFNQKITRQQDVQLNAMRRHMDQLRQADDLQQNQQLEEKAQVQSASKSILVKDEKQRAPLEAFSFASF